MHRRCRALIKLQKLVLNKETPGLTQTMLTGVLCPVVTFFVFNAKAEKAETLEVLHNKAVDNTSNLVTVSVKTLGATTPYSADPNPNNQPRPGQITFS